MKSAGTAQGKGTARDSDRADESVPFATRIPRRLVEGIADLADDLRRAGVEREKRTIAKLTADAIEAFLTAQKRTGRRG